MSTDLRPVPLILDQVTHALTVAVENALVGRRWFKGIARYTIEQDADPTPELHLTGTPLVRRVYLEYPHPRRLLLVEKTTFVPQERGFTLTQEVIPAREWLKGGAG